MRSDPPMSVRQRRLMELNGPIRTVRQKSVIERSDRTARTLDKQAQRLVLREHISYDVAAARLAEASRRASVPTRRKKSKTDSKKY